jgi:hypothetical protein
MTGLAFVCGIAALFVLVFFWENLGNEGGIAVRPAGLLRWLASGNWPAKVGATLLLISTGALLRYLIVTTEFPPTWKLGAGILAVAVLGGLSAYLHGNAKRRAIYLALGGAALGVAYLTAYSAYGFFSFISSIQALGLLFLVACAATVFALEARAQSIAILAMAGAFIAPAFALDSPGVLPVYGYYLLASLLVLLMVALRGWRPLIHLSFLFTLAGALFFGWTQKFYEPAYFSQMHPLLLGLVAIHLLMPLLEQRESSTQDAWLRRFDNSYFLLLPLVSALLMILLAPNDAVDGAIGLLELGVLWGLAAGIQRWRFGTGAGRYIAVALTLLFVAALLAFQDVPYFLMAASAACVLLAASRMLRLSDGWSTALAVVALASSACYVMQSLLKPAVPPPFLNAAYLCHVILGVSLLLAAYGSRVHQSRTFTSVYLVFAIAWLVIASVRELIILDLDYLPQLAYLIVLAGSAVYAVVTIRRPASMAITLLLGFAMYLSGVFCARLLSTPALFAAVAAGQLVFLGLAHAAGRHLKADGEAIAGITRSLLPILMLPLVGAYSAEIRAPHLTVVMTFLVSSALLASLHAQLTMPKGSFWPNTLSPVGFVVFGLWLFYQTLFHIDRSSWSVVYELIALLYIALTVLSLQRSQNRDARLFSLVVILAVATTSAAMFLRAFGPPGTLTILAINQMLLPAVVSLFWAVIGGLMTWWAKRTESRWLWVLGALLLVVAAIKLVLFDFGSLGQLGNILAMMAAGGVFMAVAWLAPFPPKREIPEEAPAPVPTQARVRVPPPPLPSSPRPLQAGNAAINTPDGTSGSIGENQANAADEAADTDYGTYAADGEGTSTNRTWVWVLAGLMVVFFFYHSGGRSHSKPVVLPAEPHQASTPGVGLNPIPPVRSEIPRSVPQSNRESDGLSCSRFIQQLPENYEIYAALGPSPTGLRGRSTVRVHVNKPGTNVLLVLAANDAVTWQIGSVDGGRIIGVVLSGQRTGVLEDFPSRTPTLVSTDENGAPCGTFDAEQEAQQGVYRFVSKLLTRVVDGVVISARGRVDIGASSAGTGSEGAPLKRFSAPYGISCHVPEWNSPQTSCSGKVLASGSMNNSDLPADAAKYCSQAGVAGSCCMYHLYGVGKWYLTDGEPQQHGRLCEDGNGNHDSCYAGGACTANQPYQAR